MTTIDFTVGPVDGEPEPRWIHGENTDPAVQVYRRDEHTFVIRQSKTRTYEAPFCFLLFGNDRALLLDSGATKTGELREAVDGVVADWLVHNPRTAYPLVVGHTHSHGDHIAGDDSFADRPDTSIVGSDLASVQAFFNFTDWPAEVVQLDLGGRILDVTGIPGHHATSIAVYDPWSGALMTGDTVYPGRLYVEDQTAFADSLGRLVEFAAARDIRVVYGCHIEMTRQRGRDYPLGCTYQPDEPALGMSPDRLVAVRDKANAITRSGPYVADDFIIWNGAQARLLVTHVPRLLATKLRRR